MSSKGAHAHRLVAETAKSLTAELYDTLMASNQIRAEWVRKYPDLTEAQRLAKFIRAYWPRALPAARATLARMLAGPLDPKLQDSIHEALVLDASLVRGRANVA